MPRPSTRFILVIFFVSLAGSLFAPLKPACCWGADKEFSGSAITLDSQNEPLRSVLGKISRTTRWKIKAPDPWLDRPVTQTLNKATLEDGLRSVLRSAGVEDLLLLYDENMKEVTLFDTEGPQKQAAGRPAAPANPQQRFVSTTGQPDPILKRAAERAAGNVPARGNRRSRRNTASDDE